MPTYPTTAKVERKVKVGSALTYLISVGALAAVNAVSDTTLITDLPDTVEIFVAPLVPSLAAFISGYLTKHTPRPDLAPAQR